MTQTPFKTRIIIVDDYPVVVEGVSAFLASCEDVEVVGAFTDARQALKEVDSLKAQIVIMEVSMPQLNSVDATREIKKIDPDVKVIIYTRHSYHELIFDLAKVGISAYVLKNKPLSDLYQAIQVVRRGGNYFSDDPSVLIAKHLENMVDQQRKEDRFNLLTPREREIFLLIAEGHSIKRTADLLLISRKTVETHKYRIMEKLEISRMDEWTKEAIRRGIINVN